MLSRGRLSNDNLCFLVGTPSQGLLLSTTQPFDFPSVLLGAEMPCVRKGATESAVVFVVPPLQPVCSRRARFLQRRSQMLRPRIEKSLCNDPGGSEMKWEHTSRTRRRLGSNSMRFSLFPAKLTACGLSIPGMPELGEDIKRVGSDDDSPSI